MKCAFHLHTIFSRDGYNTLDCLHAEALRLGVDCLFITDYDTLDGALQFRRRFDDVEVVLAQEVDTLEGKVLGLFLERSLAPLQHAADTVRAIKEQGGLVCLPYGFDRVGSSTLHSDAQKSIRRQIDLLEVFNGRSSTDVRDARASRLAQEMGLPVIWGSDTHYPEEIGHVIFELPDFQDSASFIEALRQARALRMRRTRFRERVLFGLRGIWGLYAPTRLPEDVFLACERALLRGLGVTFLSLGQVDELCLQLVRRVKSSGFDPEVVLGVAEGGLYPGCRIARGLNLPRGSICISHRQLRIANMDADDVIGGLFLRSALKGRQPEIKAAPDIDIEGKRVLLVDDDCATGDTLRMALNIVGRSTTTVRTATLRRLAHANPMPDYCAEDYLGHRFRHPFRHPRFPWIKYSPYYREYWQFKRMWLDHS